MVEGRVSGSVDTVPRDLMSASRPHSPSVAHHVAQGSIGFSPTLRNVRFMHHYAPEIVAPAPLRRRSMMRRSPVNELLREDAVQRKVAMSTPVVKRALSDRRPASRIESRPGTLRSRPLLQTGARAPNPSSGRVSRVIMRKRFGILEDAWMTGKSPRCPNSGWPCAAPCLTAFSVTCSGSLGWYPIAAGVAGSALIVLTGHEASRFNVGSAADQQSLRLLPIADHPHERPEPYRFAHQPSQS